MSSIQLPSCDNPRKFKHFNCELPCEATDFSSIGAVMAELQCHVDEGADMEFEDPDQFHAGGCLKATAAPLNAPDSVHPDHSGSMDSSGDHHSGDWYGSDSGSMGHSGDQDSVSAPQTLEQYISVMSPPLPFFSYYSDVPNCAAACGTSGYSSTTVPQVETVWTGQWVMETSEAGSVCSGASPDGVTNISSLVVRSDECAPLICLTIISNEYDG